MTVYKNTRNDHDSVKSYQREFRGETRVTLTFRTIDRSVSENAEEYTIKQGDNLDALAFEYYGDELLWHIIADKNPEIDPLDLVPGTVIVIPPLEEVSLVQS